MNTARWLTNRTPGLMLRMLGQSGVTTERKYRLLAVACWRRVWDQIPDDLLRALIDAQEAFADGKIDEPTLRSIINPTFQVSETNFFGRFYETLEPGRVLNYTAYLVSMYDSGDRWLADRAESRAQANLIREIFGDPFRPSTFDPAWIDWEGGTIPRLAAAIYEEKAFDRMPILGDALEEAGCADSRILDHCRKPGEHVRGCWVVDALIGKAWSPGPPDFPPPRPFRESIRH